MLIAILSDTHSRTNPLIAAIDMLRGRGAEHYIHCGDVGGEEVLDCLAGLPAVTFVWGNNDWDVRALEDYAQNLNVTCAGRAADLILDGKRFAVIHGDNASQKAEIVKSQQHDYLLQGHTHVFNDQRIGRMRLINPGALYRANYKTVALLDTATDKLERVIVG